MENEKDHHNPTADTTRGPGDRSNPASVLTGAAITGRGAGLNPFVVLDDAQAFLRFVVDVLGGSEVVEARTRTPTGRLIHAEVRVGDSLLLVADTQPGWSARPGLFQVWVSDAAGVLAAAVHHGATVVTPPTPFYGELTLARVADRWDNLWWLFQPTPGQADPTPAWEGGSDVIFRTLDDHLRSPDR